NQVQASRPRIRLSADGIAATLAYQGVVVHGEEARSEPRLAYLTAAPGASWFKGGAFNAPLDVAIARDGAWVVTLDTQQNPLPRFRLYGRGGDRRYAYPSPAEVLIAAGSLEGRNIAVYRKDS